MVLVLTCINILAGLMVYLLLTYVWPTHYFAFYPLIPVYFWIVGVGMAVSMEITHSENPDAITMTYMVARSVKLMLTGLFVGAYAWLVKDNIKEFGLTTLAFYLIFLALESFVFFLYEKRRAIRAFKRREATEKRLIQEEEDEAAAEPYAGKEAENEEMDV
jgi:hypothetical protein